ncbi:CheR family methyltransferase [Mangrovitalea sediminis]|uniref:CheR family methyltransferase n=1 Tax=Mangrovitalea sediminis TaxID=1982043 RepID=UPI000BE5A28E|nr:CheR family methyltransferase [Mangrovitalea sediminis]
MDSVGERGREPVSDDREFSFSQSDFETIRGLLYQRAGIRLADGKRQLVYSRLTRRLRSLGLRHFSAYITYLLSDEAEFEHFINALTTNLTAFFREPHHFITLTEFLQERRSLARPLSIWCAAASTGEEPYSIAMVVAEAFASYRPPVKILASDIDSQVLRHAERGVYELSRIDAISAERKHRFFLKGKGQNTGFARVVPDIRAMVTFRQINLLDPHWDLDTPIDAIFCRNVMIYFDKKTQRRLLERMIPLLTPDGLYFAGHSESFVNAGNLVRLVGHSVYRPVTSASIQTTKGSA